MRRVDQGRSSDFPGSRPTGSRPSGSSVINNSRTLIKTGTVAGGSSHRSNPNSPGAEPTSAPELSGRQRRSLRESFELSPGDLRMDAAAEAAVGGRDHALLADQVGEAHDPLGDELGMLDHVGSMAHDAGQDQLAVRELHVLTHFQLVLVSH